MPARPLTELIAPDWAHALAPVEPQVAAMGEFLRAEVAAGRTYLPAATHILRAFTHPMADVRVLIVGQDPYPTPGHPVGLCFSVEREVRRLPPSLVNIYKELHADLGIEPAGHGDLSAWADHGVLLLNRVLTVRPRAPACTASDARSSSATRLMPARSSASGTWSRSASARSYCSAASA